MTDVEPLTDAEIQEFYESLDKDKDERVSLKELEQRLNIVNEELTPRPAKWNINHPSRTSTEDDEKQQKGRSDLHDFLLSLLPEECRDEQCQSVDKKAFLQQVRSWHIPSLAQPNSSGNDDKEARDYDDKLPLRRRLSAWWSVKGPEVLFLAFVAALTLAMSLWQGLKYVTDPLARAALGWGVTVAKFSAGALYPLFFFLILSMSRWFATFCRHSFILSRFINWDLSQSFHIKMSILALFFACLHAIGHLTGTFLYGSRPAQQDDLALVLGPQAVPKRYKDFVASRPGWSGLTAIVCFILVSLTSLPAVRKWSYELFQLFHLLMYPIFAMLALHGTAYLLQAPMFGYWIAFPVILVATERSLRLSRSFFMHHPGTLVAIDDATVVVTVDKPEGKSWRAYAGQYIYLQVPGVSRFQWHPFTISRISGSRLQVHIKAEGSWTRSLLKLAKKSEDNAGESDHAKISVGVDGPFGAPAQRWHTFDKSLVIGAGIGVTPFAAILSDLEQNYYSRGDPWKLTRKRSFARSRTLNRERTLVDEQQGQTNPEKASRGVQSLRRSKAGSTAVRRVDFHWSVRERDQLQWFAELLNRASDLAEQDDSNLTLNIHAHITSKKKDIATHIFRWMLDSYQTPEHPYSALTGLRNPSHFGRPDYESIISQFYDDMCEQGWTGRVGIFFCGPPAIGEMLSDLASVYTARSRHENRGMRFLFHNEVFN